MALSVSGLYSPSLEKNSSEFLGSNSMTPSPTSYNSTSDIGRSSSPKNQPYPPFAETNGSQTTVVLNKYPAYPQQSPPPSSLRSPKLDGEPLGRARGQSASSRPTLRLHIANPTDPPASYMQEQAVRSQTKVQTGSGSPNRRRGETFSEFSNPTSSGLGSPAPAGTSLAIPEAIPGNNTGGGPMRITTTNLNFTGSNFASLSVSSATTKRPFRASPLLGPQALTMQGSATSGTNSSSSTAPASFFADDSYPSSVSTPATQESASEFSSHSFRAPNAGTAAGVRHRPLPVPPPSSATIPSSKVSSPLSAPAPAPPLPHPPYRSVTPSAVPSHGNKQSQHPFYINGHERSSSGELNAHTNQNDPISAELAYRLEKRRGKQTMRGDLKPESPPVEKQEEEIPYELRSEKWKGKQKMRDSAYDTLNSPVQQFVSPPSALLSHSDTTSSSREMGLPPSLSGSFSNRPSRASISSSHSSSRSIGGGGSESGVSKWKGKDKESSGGISFGKEELKKSGSLPNSIQADSLVSSSPLAAPLSVPAPVPSHPHTFASHPSALIPGSYQSVGRAGIAGPRPVGDASVLGRSASSPKVAWSSSPQIPLYVVPPLPLNVRKVTSPATSPVVSPAPKLPPKDPKYQLLQALSTDNPSLDDSPMHTHPFIDDDSDDEGRKLFAEVEAVYVSPSTARGLGSLPSSTVGYGYAEAGYEDDERVYIDDGYDDPNNPYSDEELDNLDREYGFGVSASGKLVGVNQPISAAASVSVLGHGSSVHGTSSSRASLSRESERGPSPMRYATVGQLDELEDDDFDDPQNLVNPSSSSRPLENLSSFGPRLDSFSPPAPNALVNSATQILSSLNPRSPLSPHSSSPFVSRSDSKRQNQRGRPNSKLFTPEDILGDQLGISFARNPSPKRYHPTKNVYPGSLAVLAEDKVYVRGKWRMRSPSPTSPSGAGTNNAPRGKGTPGGGLRRYASEESLLSAGVASSETNHGYGEEDGRFGGAGFAPLRSSGFEEFNLTTNIFAPVPKKYVERASTPDSSESFPGKKSLSHHSHGSRESNGRQTPNLRGAGTKPPYADDLGFGGGWKAAVEAGRDGRRGRVNERPAKLEKKKSVKSIVSPPRSSSVGTRPGVLYQPPPNPSEHISYDLWIERGMDQTSPAVKGKKTPRI